MVSARGLWVIGLAVCACEAQPSPRVNPARSDKQALFGSASLVPTREGERVRRELAIAGELQHALEHLGLGPAHVDVELGPRPAVIVVAQQPSDRSPAEAHDQVAELSSALIPKLESTGLHAWLRPTLEPGTPPNDQALPAPLWALLALSLGLGLSLGIVSERARARLR